MKTKKRKIDIYLRSLKFHLKIILENKIKFFGGTIILIISIALNAIPPYIIKLIVDSMEKDNNFNINYLIVIYISAVIFQGVLFYIARALHITIALKIEKILAQKTLDKYLILSKEFYSNYETGDLLTRVTRDVSSVFTALAFSYGLGIMFIFNVSFMGIAMLFISLKLTLIFYSIFITFPIIISLLEKFIIPKMKLARIQVAKISSFAKEIITSIRTVKGYRKEKQTEKFFSIISDDLLKTNMKIALIMSYYMPVFEILGGIMLIILIYYGGKNVISNSISIGDFIALQQYCTRLIFTFISLGWIISMLQRHIVAFERVEEILNRTDEIKDNENALRIKTIQGKLEVKDLNYKFKKLNSEGDNKYTSFELKNISFNISPGQTIAFVGSIGSGKSLILSLLNRFYSISDNKIFIDDIDINKLELKQLRKIIGYIEQETYLFGQTIKDNLIIGTDRYLGDEELNKYLEIVNIKKEIELLANGLDTIVGEKGITLSGGQKQRLSIARALIAEPEILIFDDSLSALDVDTENYLLENLKNTNKNSTKIIVTHRLTSIQNVDEIFVFKDGTIIEKGDHNSLIEKKGEYFKLYQNTHKDKK